MDLTITNARLTDSDELFAVNIRNGRIYSILAPTQDQGTVIDCHGCMLSAGFIDVHIHGAIGHDVNSSEAAELLEIATFLAKNGVCRSRSIRYPELSMDFGVLCSARLSTGV